MTKDHILLAALSTCALLACERSSGEEATQRRSAEAQRSPFDPEHPSDPLDLTADPTPLGTWALSDDYRMRAIQVRTCDVEPYFAPGPGREKLGVLVEIEGQSTREVPVNALHASLEDAEGQSYAPTLAGCRPGLPAGRITAGALTRGFISFEIPTDARNLTLHYEPFIVGRPRTTLHFALER